MVVYLVNGCLLFVAQDKGESEKKQRQDTRNPKEGKAGGAIAGASQPTL
jgi:hypothetical protein